MKLTSILFKAVGAATVVLAPVAAHASLIGNMKGTARSTGGGSGLSGGSLPELAGSIIGGFLGLLGVFLAGIVIYAGYLWMTAQGNDEKVKQAKKMISNAVVGLVLIVAAYAITDFVLRALDTATGGTGSANDEPASIEEVTGG